MKTYLILITLITILSSCDSRWQFLEGNIPPNLTFKFADGQFKDGEGNFIVSLTDTFKLSNKSEEDNFEFSVKYIDDNLQELSYKFVSGDGQIIQKNALSDEEGVLDISKDELELEFVPFGLGDYIITFSATDIYGEKSEIITLNLHLFDNMEPVSKLEVKHIGKTNKNQYLLNAHTSYDPDSKYGGAIVQYRFNIGEYHVSTTSQQIDYIFQNSGKYKVTLAVMDNDEVWSEITELTVDVK
ncbi:MAG: PKD domain-containing protein [Flammeovirgaceae bacterium]|nr:PKD domain-containing protein [Flammeovirgaceae bacterium]